MRPDVSVESADLQVFREIEASDCPLRAGAYYPGCSTLPMSSIQIYAGFRIRTYGNLPSANMGEYRKERRKGPGLLCPGPLIGSRSVTIPELVSAALQVERNAVGPA